MVWSNGLWQLVRQSDAVSITVLLLLLGMSIICWTVFLYAWVLNRIKQKQLTAILKKIKEITSTDDLIVIATSYGHTIGGYFLSQVLVSVKSVMELPGEHMSKMEQFECMRDYIDQAVDNAITQQERYLPILSTSAAVAPLLGLFGTVWGLVHAFLSISEKQAADITVVAPGIAQALITTLVGLIVAIPALVMYNVLATQSRNIEHKLYQLADSVSLEIKKLLLS